MSAPTVKCPCCGHAFTPAPDPAAEGWKRRTGRIDREPWNKHETSGGFWRRVRMFVAIVSPSFKYSGLSKRVDGWDWQVECWDPELVAYDVKRPKGDRVLRAWRGRRTKLEAQQGAIADARKLVELLEGGSIELVWGHCHHGYTNRLERTRAGRRPCCPECRALEDELDRQARAPGPTPGPATSPAAARAALRLVRS